jgi:hypothetical protein
MATQLTAGPDQLRDLAVLRDLGGDILGKIISTLSDLTSATKPSEIEEAIKSHLPDEKADKLTALMRMMMSLYALRRQRDMNVEELIEGLNYAIDSSSKWEEGEIEKWRNLDPQIRNFFSLTTVMSVVKVLDLSYDYSNLLQNTKILTDVRPVFNDEATCINGSVVSFTLRLYYNTLSESKTLSIALDKEDIIRLRKQCERALVKADTAKRFMVGNSIPMTVVAGEDDES